jgi:hypothetical protein
MAGGWVIQGTKLESAVSVVVDHPFFAGMFAANLQSFGYTVNVTDPDGFEYGGR